MKVYSIFLIRKEFALHFYQKSDILLHFIQSYYQNESKKELEKQFNYVTIDLIQHKFMKHIEENIHSKIRLTTHQEQIEMSQEGIFITLIFSPKWLKVYCQSLTDAETLLFPLLRTFHPYTFVISNDFNHYKHFGWITPISKNKYNKNSQILYSNG